MDAARQKRRIARIPVSCSVVIREKFAVWSTSTEDIGSRGCRIALPRSLGAGTVVQLRFDRGGATTPLEVVGQVAWARGGSSPAAGIAFVTLPRDPAGTPADRNWLDALVAAHLRRALERRTTGSLWSLRDVALQLGIPPTEPLQREEVELVRRARAGIALAEACATPEGLRAVSRLLERGVMSVCRATPDPEGWKQTLSRLVDAANADSSSPRTAAGWPAGAATNGAAQQAGPSVIIPPHAAPSPAAPSVIVPPPPRAFSRQAFIAKAIEELLQEG